MTEIETFGYREEPYVAAFLDQLITGRAETTADVVARIVGAESVIGEIKRAYKRIDAHRDRYLAYVQQTLAQPEGQITPEMAGYLRDLAASMAAYGELEVAHRVDQITQLIAAEPAENEVPS